MTILVTGAPSNVVFLSIQGADRNRAVPHRAVKDHLRGLADSLDVRPGGLLHAEPVHHPRPRDPRNGRNLGTSRPWPTAP
jgi:hypothetical protein